MKRSDIVICVIAGIITLSVYADEFFNINRMVYKQKLNFEVPKIRILKSYIPETNIIGDPTIWGMKKITMNKKHKNTKKTSLEKQKKTQGYVLKAINGVLSLCRISNKKYRWEFYGIISKNSKKYGVFYNPLAKQNKIKTVGENDYIDSNLSIVSIGSDNLTILYKTNKIRKVYVMKLFNFNKAFFNSRKEQEK